jgi:amino acid adenylation domain-containing protein
MPSPDSFAPAVAASTSLSTEESQPLFLPSFAQERLWFLDQLEPHNPVYNVHIAKRLRGPLHVATLERSLQAIVERHEVLRTTLVAVEGRPMQAIAPHLALPLPLLDLTSLPDPERESLLGHVAATVMELPFDLARGPLVRTYLLRLAANEHVLLATFHHAIADGWSGELFWQELPALYHAFLLGQPSPLPDLPLQYADFAAWQRETLQGATLDAHLAYWREHLRAAPALLDLPLDHPRPAQASYRGAHYRFQLPASLLKSLTALSQREGVTLFMTLLAAFQTLLLRYTGQHDLVLGTPIAGRTRRELHSLFGLFANTLVLRTDLSGNPSFLHLLQRVREVCLNAYDHQDLPFEKLVEELHPERSLSYSPLFQVFLSLGNFASRPPSLPGLTIVPLQIDRHTARFDLVCDFFEEAEGLSCRLEYNTDLFEAGTIERLASHLHTLLESIVAHPQQRLWDLPVLPAAEQNHLLHLLAAPPTPAPTRCLHALLAAQVAQHPDAIALSCEDQHLSAATLDARANQLAHALQQLGVGPDARVGLCLDRSPDLLISALAVLKAGGAYVPLDPHYPAERLAFIAQDASLSVLLTQQPLLAHLPALTCPVLCLDRDWPLLAHLPSTPPTSLVLPDHLAYVLYTSGSTGRPKGVQISHAALVNFLTSFQQRPGLPPQDTWLAVTSLAFDIAALELFLPLLVGARLDLASHPTTQDGSLLAAHLVRSGASVLQATPATWRLLLAAGWQGQPGFRLLCGGEALPSDLAAALLSGGADLWNLYGPTETTIWSSLQPVHALEPERPFVPLGHPLANTRLYILDPYGHLAPTGVPGELCIAGAGLARGYLGRPDLTAERFLPDPFSSIPGARLYRTGDQVRLRADGTLEYLGRLDFQVKLRGYRIELGEIERVLTEQPDVAQAVVVLRAAPAGDQRLVAYVVPATSAAPPTPSQLRQALQQRLPEYMLPAAFVPLAALPLTPNGKLDRRALPAPEWTEQSVSTYEAPGTPTETRLAALWAQVLGVEQVGRHDNFFFLGGHSLLATQLMAQLLDSFQVSLPLRTLFEAPTLAAFAARLDQLAAQPSSTSSSSTVPLARGARFGRSAPRLADSQ